MRKAIFAGVLGALLFSGAVLAEEAEPIKLTAAQMDSVTAGGLGLPNDKEVFRDFDNPSPLVAFGFLPLHPALIKFFENGQPATEGPWQAHFQSPTNNPVHGQVIECIGCP